MPLAPDLAKRQRLALIEGADGWTPDVRENESAHAGASRAARHVERRGMTSHAAGEPDRPRPSSGFGEHQVGPACPANSRRSPAGR